MIEDIGEILYQKDNQLISSYLKGPNSEGARDFALDYATLKRDCDSQCIGTYSEGEIDYFKVETSWWNYTIEQAEIGNFYPLKSKLQYEARDLFVSDESDVEELATALINLARSIIQS